MKSTFSLDKDLARDLAEISQSVQGFDLGKFVNDAIRAAVYVQKAKVNPAEARAKARWKAEMKRKGAGNDKAFREGQTVKFQ